MTNKQSSIEYYIVNLINILGDEICKKITIEQNNRIVNLEKQAKAMHKDEMIEFSQEVFRNRYNQVHQSLGNIADDVYHETFEGGNK